MTLPDKLVAARVIVTKLKEEVYRLIADNQANEIVSLKVSAERDALAKKIAKQNAASSQ